MIRGIACAAGLVALFCLGLDAWRAFDSTFFFVFQARDIARARELLAGTPIFFGPEMTGGGNLPGPLYYLLLAIPLSIASSWQAAWAFMVLLAAAGGVAGWYWLRTRISAPAAWFWLVVYSGTFFTRVLLEMFMNISFTFLFGICALLAICESCSAQSPRRRELAFALACLCLGLGIQLHLSLIFLLPAFLILRPVGARAMGKGLLVFLLPSLPYFFWLLAGSGGFFVGQAAGLAGKGRDALPTIVSFAANLTRLPFSETLAHSGRLLEVLPAPLVLFFLAALAKPGAAPKKEATIIRALLVCAGFGLIPFAYFFVAPIGRRYVVPLGLPLLLLSAVVFEGCRRSPARLKIFAAGGALLIAALFLVIFLGREVGQGNARLTAQLLLGAAAFGFAAFACGEAKGNRALPTAAAVALGAALCFAQRGVLERGYTNTSHVAGLRYVPSAAEWRAVWTVIRSRTCWSYEEARRRVFYANHHLEQEPSFSWELPVAGSAGCREGEARASAPDGFIVSIQKRDSGDPLAWLLEQNLQSDLKRGLASGAVELVGSSLSRGFLVIPYRVKDKESFPPFFHNTATGYLRAGNYAFPEPAAAPANARALPDGRLLFRWNECEGLRPFCDTGAFLRLERAGRSDLVAKVSVEGAAISQTSPWISPNWTELWRRPYVELSCGGRPQRAYIADSIGYDQANGHSPGFPFDYNNSFVAPFYRELRFRCAGKPTAVTVGREETVAESIRASRRLPARSLTLSLP